MIGKRFLNNVTGTGDVERNLIVAALSNDMAEVERILTVQPSASAARDARTGDTILHIAISLGNAKMVKYILEAGSLSPFRKNFLRRTSLDFALEGINPAVRSMVLKRCAKELGLDEDGWNAEPEKRTAGIVKFRPKLS